MKKISIGKINQIGKVGGLKAIRDVEDILKSNGYEIIKDFSPLDYQYMTYDKYKNIYYPSALTKIEDSILVLQYPYFDINRFSYESILKYSKNLGIITVALIHDINSARGFNERISLSNYEHSYMTNVTDCISEKNEINLLNQHDFLIVHSESMKKWLEYRGVTSTFVIKEAFDYLHSGDLTTRNDKTFGGYEIVYAGSLKKYKCGFIYNLSQIKNVKFNLYGDGFEQKYMDPYDNKRYFGSFNSNEIVCKLSGDFGLIWDGDSLDTCGGKMGQYLSINYPHKVSLYILANLPVIVWDKSSVSKFILENNIGITISSLNELSEKLQSITYEEYNIMKNNTLSIRKKLMDGYYLKKSLNCIETLCQEIYRR